MMGVGYKKHKGNFHFATITDIHELNILNISENIVKVSIYFRWQLPDRRTGGDQDAVVTVEITDSSYNIVKFDAERMIDD